MFQQFIDNEKERFDRALDALQEDLAKVRTGRAHAGLLDGVMVDAYGAKTPVNQVATVSVPEPRMITISPWDKGIMTQIEAAIRESDLGLNPANDGNLVRLTLPPLTEERRQDMVKVMGKRVEEARVSVRKVREGIWEAIQEAEKAGEISEDDKFAGKDVLQKLVDEYNAKIEEMKEKKEEEIMTV